MAKSPGARQDGECNDYERSFAISYAKCFNQKKAAMDAGATEERATQEGHRLFKLLRVKTLIDQTQEMNRVASKVTVERVLQELYRVATADPRGCFKKDGTIKSLDDIDEDLRRCIQSIETETVMRRDPEDPKEFIPVEVTKIKFWSKTETLRDLGRYLKMFTDNVNLSGKVATVKDLLLADGPSSDGEAGQ